jgi:hypothetical protein
MKYAVEMTSCGITYVPSFLKIGGDIQAMLRFNFRNVRSCNFGVIDGRDL